MSDEFNIPKYYKAGFWYLAFHNKYTGFCHDVQYCNDEVITQEDMNWAWKDKIKELHKIWIRGDGRRGSKAQQDKYLFLATAQIIDEKADAYWRKLGEIPGRTDLLDDTNLAGMDWTALVNEHDTKLPELKDGVFYSQEELDEIYKRVYKVDDSSLEEQDKEKKMLELQLRLLSWSKVMIEIRARKVEEGEVDDEMAEKMSGSNLLDDMDMMDLD